MLEMLFPDRSLTSAYADHSSTPTHPLELWRLRGATDDLRGLAIETSFGHALALELDHELVFLHLQPSVDVLVTYADRIESALLAQGWQRVAPRQPRTEACA